MSITLNDTLSAAKQVLSSVGDEATHAVDTAKHAAETARDGADHAVAGARTTWFDGVKAVAGVVAMLRGFQANDALGWVGLTRRRSPMAAIGLFGAGMAVGAGAALLFAPTSGEETRRRILSGLNGLKGEAKGALDSVGAELKSDVKAASEKVEEVASQAKGAVIAAEHKVEAGAVALEELVTSKVDATIHAVKEAATASKHDASKPAMVENSNGKVKSDHPS